VSTPQTVAQVIERLEALHRELPKTDGLAHFNELYLPMTLEIDGQLGKQGFEDPRFLEQLDVRFADRYFAAIDAGRDHDARSPAWAPLFEARAHKGIAPIQFALAGCNAHINYDLAVALVDTCRELDVSLERDSAQHRDFLKVNAILVAVEAKVKKSFDEGLVGMADEALGRLDDVVAMWSMERGRDAAWTHAEVLWKLRDVSALEDHYVATLAHIVGMAGRGLLVRVL
jgi:Family of unknown function (DUF5995)